MKELKRRSDEEKRRLFEKIPSESVVDAECAATADSDPEKEDADTGESGSHHKSLGNKKNVIFKYCLCPIYRVSM